MSDNSEKPKKLGGRGKIHLHPNAGKGGFHVNPQNINRKGAITNFTGTLNRILKNDGEMTFPKNQIVKVNSNGSVIIKMPTREVLCHHALKVITNGKDGDKIRAFKVLLEFLEAKPTQKIETTVVSEKKLVIESDMNNYLKYKSEEE